MIISGIRTQHIHPDGSLSPVFQYAPNYTLVKIAWIGGYIQRKNMKQPGVWITRLDGVRIFRPNNFDGYAHILPLKPGPNDIF